MLRLLALMIFVTLVFHPTALASTTSSDCVEPFEAEVVRIVNAERAAHGLTKLAISDTLSAADEHMVQSYSHHGYTGHELWNGTSASQNRAQHGYTSNTWQGQVVATGQQSPAAVVAAWMGSGPHRDVILSPHYRAIGSGYTKGVDGVRYWALDFGGFRDSKADWC